MNVIFSAAKRRCRRRVEMRLVICDGSGVSLGSHALLCNSGVSIIHKTKTISRVLVFHAAYPSLRPCLQSEGHHTASLIDLGLRYLSAALQILAAWPRRLSFRRCHTTRSLICDLRRTISCHCFKWAHITKLELTPIKTQQSIRRQMKTLLITLLPTSINLQSTPPGHRSMTHPRVLRSFHLTWPPFRFGMATPWQTQSSG